MEISYDLKKEKINRKKHKISLKEAAKLDLDTLERRFDAFDEYGEAREIGFGFIGDSVHCVVFVQRGNVQRVISLRRATKSEAIEYETKFFAK